MSAATSTFDVVVPAGCTPGTRFLTTVHGVQMKVRVPPGVQPGQTVRITVDVPPPQLRPKKPQLEQQQQQQQQQQQLSAKMAALASDCPGRHGLQTCLALNPHFRCDVCHCAVPFNAHLRSCRRCNWDVCSKCYTTALAQHQHQHQQLRQPPPPQQQQDQHRVVSDCSTASQAELAAARNCPGHHGLRAFVAPNPHFRCDVCHQAVPLDGLLHACRRCNYDVCDGCNSRAAEAAVSASASAAVATAARLPDGGAHHTGSGGGGGGGDDSYDGGDGSCDGDDDHRIANADAPNCPGYHGLAAFIAPSAGFRCDMCRQTAAGRMHGCRRCNWDVCDACMQYPQVYHRQQHSSLPQSSAAEAATAEAAAAATAPPIPPRPTAQAATSVPLQATKAASSSSSSASGSAPATNAASAGAVYAAALAASSSSAAAAVYSVPLQAPPPRPARGSGLFINDAEIAADVVAATPGLGGIPAGQRCWHDPASGAWGVEGGPCLGVFHAGQRIPGAGALSGDASVRGGGARTGVFVNGRELHLLDVLHFRHLGIACVPGRWTIDALGTIRLEGTPGNTGVVGNVALAALATQQRQQQGRRGVPGGALSTYDKCGVAVL